MNPNSNPDAYTETEMIVMRYCYGNIRAEEVAKMLGRSTASILSKARRSGLRSYKKHTFNSRVWTEDQLRILKENYGMMPSGEVAKLVGRKLLSIYQKAYQLKLTGNMNANGEYVPLMVTIPQEMIDRYLAGTPMRFLHEELGVSWHLFRRALKRQGVTPRTRAEIGLLHIDRVQEGCRRHRQNPDWKERMSAKLQRIDYKDWDGFKNKEYDFLRYKPEWKTWRKNVLGRDNHTCVMCGIVRPKTLDPHHILPKSKYPEIMYKVDNGVALCRPCHRSISWHEEEYADQFKAYVKALKALESARRLLRRIGKSYAIAELAG